MNVHHLLTFSIRPFQLQVSAVDRALFNSIPALVHFLCWMKGMYIERTMLSHQQLKIKSVNDKCSFLYLKKQCLFKSLHFDVQKYNVTQESKTWV